jgi:two-component system response regulator GlrR
MTDIQDINSPGRPSGRRRSDRVVGASRAMQEAVEQAALAARSDATVIVGGPPGSGRGHLARAIHAWSNRAGRKLTAFSAAATPEEEQQRELFGGPAASESAHVGAREGAFASAADGSLLIEGIDLLSPAARAAVVQAVKDQSFTRVGESQAIPLRARLLLTTQNGSLEPLQNTNAHHILLVPLSERLEDVLPLAAHFLAEHAAQEGTQPIGFTGDARRWLVEESWLGNVEELSERIRQAVRLAGDGAISAEALLLATESEEVPSFKEAKRAFETRYVEGLLRRCGGNISRAARLAKKDRKDFYDVIRRTGVDPAQFRR